MAVATQEIERAATNSDRSGWRDRRLEEISSKLITYGIVQPGPHVPDGVPFIQTKDLTSGILDPAEMDRTSHAIHAEYTRSAVSAGDIIVGIRASVGDIGYVPGELDAANISRGVARVSPTDEINGLFLCYAMQSQTVQNRIRREVKGSTYAEITLPALRGIEVPVPDALDEQRAIAEVLRDVDALLGVLDRMLTKKRDLKQAAMQQLLTGQTRLPGFTREWEEKTLKELLASARLGGNYPNSEATSNFPLMKMGNVGRGEFNVSKVEYVPNDLRPGEHDRLRNGDVLFNTRNTLDLVGKVAVWRDELPCAYYNSNLLRLNFNDRVGSSFFMNALLNSAKSIQQLREMATGTTSVAAIYTRDLMSLRLRLPIAPSEQSAIAEVLSDMDAEIAALERRRKKTQNLKQGMMQELLTGKTRLV